MSFEVRDLRRGKDVFDANGTYLGVVAWVMVARPADDERQVRRPVDRAPPGAPDASTAHEPAFNGEASGPMPTAALGNGGPRSQSASQAYATSAAEPAPTAARRPVELIVVRLLTALNWSTLRPRISRIPVGLVQVVSQERIVLAVPQCELG